MSVALFQKILLKLDPEMSHRAVVTAMIPYQAWLRGINKPPTRFGAPIRFPLLPGLTFYGRVGLAAGFDKNAEMYVGLASFGFSFLEVGTVTVKPQPGNPGKRIFRVPPAALVNRLGFNNDGLERFRNKVRRDKKYLTGVPLFVNIGRGKDTPEREALNDYKILMERLCDLADAFVVNISSPNTAGLRALQETGFLSALATVTPKSIPVFIKLTGDLTDEKLFEIASFIREENKFTGIVVSNTSTRLAQEHGFDEGGLSGPPLFGRALQSVAIARKGLGDKKLLIGVGGISSVTDAKKMRAAGADLIEIYTAFIYQGPKLVRELAEIL